MKVERLKEVLGQTDMYLIDLIQKGYFDKDLKIIDVGCGLGRNIKIFESLGHHVVGVDSSERAVQLIQEKMRNKEFPDIQVRVGELGKLAGEYSGYDFVICNAVLHFAHGKAHFESMFSDLMNLIHSNGVVFIRLVTSHTFSSLQGPFNRGMELPDGSWRYVVDFDWLTTHLFEVNKVRILEELKTVNVANKRTMTTLVLTTK
jgi:2-polyprenyl-3-methyl-5-hydroxy-6-metoxy-1,4-benzoquinol methylase